MKFTAAVLFVWGVFLFSGCGSSQPVEQLSAEKRFAVGMKLFNDGDYLEAIEDFKIVTLQFQGSAVADAAQYYLAECRYEREEFILAAYEYETLLKTMPTSKYAAKARFKRAMCYYRLSPPSYLDQDYSRKAIDEFQAFIEYSPVDSLVHDAESKISELNTKLAKKDYDDGVQYMIMGYYKAAIVYFESVLEKYHDTPYAELAQLKKCEALAQRKKYADAMTEIEVFYRKYPNSQHKAEADELLAQIKQGIADQKAEEQKNLKKTEKGPQKTDTAGREP
jgi:outer membrane protein assembly factor BamD